MWRLWRSDRLLRVARVFKYSVTCSAVSGVHCTTIGAGGASDSGSGLFGGKASGIGAASSSGGGGLFGASSGASDALGTGDWGPQRNTRVNAEEQVKYWCWFVAPASATPSRRHCVVVVHACAQHALQASAYPHGRFLISCCDDLGTRDK